MKLSNEERATLADRLLEIVPEVPDAGVEEAWLEETLRRRAEWNSGRAKAVPVEEALAQMFVKPWPSVARYEPGHEVRGVRAVSRRRQACRRKAALADRS